METADIHSSKFNTHKYNSHPLKYFTIKWSRIWVLFMSAFYFTRQNLLFFLNCLLANMIHWWFITATVVYRLLQSHGRMGSCLSFPLKMWKWGTEGWQTGVNGFPGRNPGQKGYFGKLYSNLQIYIWTPESEHIFAPQWCEFIALRTLLIFRREEVHIIAFSVYPIWNFEINTSSLRQVVVD